MKWSVSMQAEGDREVTLAEVVALADAVAEFGGVASGIGTMSYGAQIIVEAATDADAVDIAIPAFKAAAEVAELPVWPITFADAISEDEEDENDGYAGAYDPIDEK